VLRSYAKFDIVQGIRMRRCCIDGSDALGVCTKDYKSTLPWCQTGKRGRENVVEVMSGFGAKWRTYRLWNCIARPFGTMSSSRLGRSQYLSQRSIFFLGFEPRRQTRSPELREVYLRRRNFKTRTFGTTQETRLGRCHLLGSGDVEVFIRSVDTDVGLTAYLQTLLR
jgi:hypothetical protein